MVTTDQLLDIVPAISVAIALVYYAINVRNANKSQQLAIESRNAQFFITLHNSIDYDSVFSAWKDMTTKPDWNTFEEWWQKYGPENNIEHYVKWLRAQITYEIYGVMLKRGFLDIELVDDMMSGPVMMYWQVSKPIIEGIRGMGYPQFQEHFEYLYEEINKIVAKQHPDFEGALA